MNAYHKLSHELASAQEMLSFDDTINSQKAAMRKHIWLVGTSALLEEAITDGVDVRSRLNSKVNELAKVFWDEPDWIAMIEQQIKDLPAMTVERNLTAKIDFEPDHNW